MGANKIGVVDYGRGNLRSVAKALESVGAETLLLAEPGGMSACRALVLPGVGSFGDCSRSLRARGFWEPLKDWLARGLPFLGICLGYQILFEGSEESPGEPGLAHWRGTVRRFVSAPGKKIPHMGWNRLVFGAPSPLFRGIGDGAYAYFVHSYHPCPEDGSLVTSRCDYGGLFAASAGRGAVQAVQFHPEKSQQVGLAMLANFVGSATGARG